MRFIDRLRGESGMTMVELMVAAAICAVGIGATIGLMDNSRQAAVTSEKRDVMAHQGQRELERLMELPWANFAHPTGVIPTSSPWAGTPNGTAFAYDRKNTAVTEQLTTATNGQVAAGFTTWNDNQARLSGRIYRYITSISANARRVTVVVTATGARSPAPLLLSSIKIDPILN
jgi:Tfp pilus assembly protein PilV